MSSEEFTYSYKPRLMGPAYEFSLAKEGLDWTIGPRKGRVGYPMIRRIRLGYKPTNMAHSRFMAEVWPLNMPKLTVFSVSARTIIDVTNQGNEYARFVRELHRRVSAANPACRFEAGFAAWRWWPSLIVGVLALLGIVYVVGQALLGAQYLVAGIIGFVGVWFLWQIWHIVTRNRPRSYLPGEIPEDVLPKA